MHELLGRSVLPAETQAESPGAPRAFRSSPRRWSGCSRTASRPRGCPSPSRGIVEARIDGLAPSEKELLHDAAVLGKVFWTDALSTISGLCGDKLDAACARSNGGVRPSRAAIGRRGSPAVRLPACRGRGSGLWADPAGTRCGSIVPRRRGSQAFRQTRPRTGGDPCPPPRVRHRLRRGGGVDVEDLRPAAVSPPCGKRVIGCGRSTSRHVPLAFTGGR